MSNNNYTVKGLEVINNWPNGFEAPVDENGRPIHEEVWAAPKRTVPVRENNYTRFYRAAQGMQVGNNFAQPDAKKDLLLTHFPGRFPDKQRLSCLRPEQIGAIFANMVKYSEKRNN
jgi:hypothetical protein